MAGGRRKGCLTCRKRKIKKRVPIPDEGTVKLPSRPKAFKFKEPIFNYGRRKRGSNQGGCFNYFRVTDGSSDDVEASENYTMSSAGSPSISMIAVSLPSSPATLLAGQLIHTLGGSNGIGFSILYFGEYFEELPVQVGHSKCMDAVLECFLTSRQCLPTSQPSSRRQLQKYGHALKLLQVQLDNDETRMQPATLCSALILHSLEVIDEDLQDNNQHFLSHADGATAILRSFGPERINSRFELQLFYAHVPTIVFKSILLDKPCFIDSPIWDRLEYKIPSSWTVDRLEASILHTYTKLPAFIRSVRGFIGLSDDLREETLHSALALRDRLSRILNNVRDFVTHSNLVVRVECHSSRRRRQEDMPAGSTSTSTSTTCTDTGAGPSTNETGPETCYMFRDIRLAEALSIFWRTLIVVTKGLRRLQVDTHDDAAAAVDAGRRLCMSAEPGRCWKPLGSLFACLNLHAARMVCPEGWKAWVGRELCLAERDLSPTLLGAVRSYIAILDV
ncbi:hypothetical protein LTS17_009325 [Exophiala oligosperma]